jgi:hypothetical protein
MSAEAAVGAERRFLEGIKRKALVWTARHTKKGPWPPFRLTGKPPAGPRNSGAQNRCRFAGRK